MKMRNDDLIMVAREWIGVLPTLPDAEARGFDRLVRLLEMMSEALKDAQEDGLEDLSDPRPQEVRW